MNAAVCISIVFIASFVLYLPNKNLTTTLNRLSNRTLTTGTLYCYVVQVSLFLFEFVSNVEYSYIYIYISFILLVISCTVHIFHKHINKYVDRKVYQVYIQQKRVVLWFECATLRLISTALSKKTRGSSFQFAMNYLILNTSGIM